ncbi:MAG: hypothetical protein FJX77_16845, partial [Armatimonadetes bacterium]|nr:hypothetical protein [Armatimonadota bacterium]
EVIRKHLDIQVEYVTPPPDPSPWEFADSHFAEYEAPLLSPRDYLYEALTRAAVASGARVLLDGIFGEAGPSAWGQDPVKELFLQGRWRLLERELHLTARNEGISRPRAFRRHVLAPLVLPPLARLRVARPGNVVLPSAGLYAGFHADYLQAAGVEPVGPPTREPFRLLPLGPGHRDEVRIGSAQDGVRLAQPMSLRATVPLSWQTPMRDLELWDYCRGLPLRLTRREGWSRYLIRAAMEGILPEEIRWRTSKRAFSPDYFTRLRTTLPRARALCEAVSPGSLAARILDFRWLEQTLLACSRGPGQVTTSVAFACQGTLSALQFLDWFERLPSGRPASLAPGKNLQV